ncbi:MAG: S41 family peptidase [Bacteroidota bacterium]
MKLLSLLFRKTKKWLFIFVISVALFFSFGFVDSYFELSKNLDIFATLLRELNTYYVDDIKPGKLIKKGIDEMLNTLDPYTEYYAESDIEDYKMMITGQYGGIGSLIRKKNDFVMIGEPYEGFPAQKSGLMAGDVITEIDGKSIKGKSTLDISKLLKGQAGTSVKVLIEREEEKKPFEITLVREEIKIKNVPYYNVVGDGIGYIKLTGFTEGAAKEVKNAFLELKEKNKIHALIFDVRDNSGGLLKESVEIVNIFVNKDQEVVMQKGKVKEMNRVHKAIYSPMDTSMPIVILANKNSASASEIVSGSIQDLDRGVIIGQRTFGKGLVQQTIQLSYGTQMKVTTAKYYTPSGRCIQAMDYFHKNPEGKAIHIPDSLIREFKTKNSRIVYDASGIYPDIFMEPRLYANVTISLVDKNLIFDYSTKYRIKHSHISPSKDFSLTEDEYKDFLTYITNKEYSYTTKSEKSLEELKKNTESEKYFESIKTEYETVSSKIASEKKEDVTKYKSEIKEILESEIASRYFYQKGRMESFLRNDSELKEAIRILNDIQLYYSILSGKGNYKIIGKPGSDTHAKSKVSSPDDNNEDEGVIDEKPEK